VDPGSARAAQHRSAHLTQGSERQLHLRLDTCRSHNLTRGRATDEIVQHRRLADADIASQEKGATLATADNLDQPVEYPDFATPVQQHVTNTETSIRPGRSIEVRQVLVHTSADPGPGVLPGAFPDAARRRLRDSGGMTQTRPETEDGRAMLDIDRALALLDAAVSERGASYVYQRVWGRRHANIYAARYGAQCLVGHVLSLMRIADEDLEELRDHDLRMLYREGRLPVRLTLGALAVLDAAQRCQDRGYAWGDALEYATSVAAAFVNLLPDVALHAAAVGA
jgi:hypothetical protein